MLLHLDTDIGTNPDDLAALAYLLARHDVELVGITVVDDPDGQRLACADKVLRLVGRDVPAASGDAAVDMLAGSAARGAVLVGIGPATNLAALERRSPGALGDVRVVLMGGWPMPPAADHNVERHAAAASAVHRAVGSLVVVPKSVTARVLLRGGDLGRVARCGPLGALVAAQIRAYVGSGRAYAHNDPLTVAIALGWDRVTTTTGVLGGRNATVVVDVVVDAFAEHWVRTLEGRVPS